MTFGFLSEIASFLQTRGYGTTGTSIFIDSMPDSPDAVIVLYGQPGQGRDYEWDGENPGLHIEIRDVAANYATMLTKLGQIVEDLDGVANTTIGGTYYCQILAAQSHYTPLPEDARGRRKVAFNFRIKKKRS